MSKAFLTIYLISCFLFYGCSEKPISEKQRAIDAYKEKQSRQHIRNDQEILLADISGVPLEIFFESLAISPNGRKVAYAGYDILSKSLYLNVNQEKHPLYSEIWPPAVFSPDSESIAYIASRKNGGKTGVFVVKDGNIISKTYTDRDITGTCIFSPDSKNIAYTARKDGQWRVIVDGWDVKYPAFDSVLANTVKFSPDSKTLVYGVRKDDQHFIAVNGVLQKPYGGIGEITITDKHLAYAAGHKNIPKMVIFEGNEQKEYDFVGRSLMISYHDDGKRLIYIAEKLGKQFVVIDEGEQKKYDGVVSISLSSDGKYLAYVVSQGEESFIVLNGKELKHYAIKDYTDGEHMRRGSILENSLVFSPDSQCFAYGAGDGVYMFMVLDGVEQKKYKSIVENSMAFSPNSQRFGYLAINYNDKPLAVVDGKEYPIVQEWAAKFCFSPDSKHFAYIVSDEGRWSVTIDGEPGKYYPGFLVDERKTLFNEDGSFHYLVMRDNKIYLVEEELTPVN